MFESLVEIFKVYLLEAVGLLVIGLLLGEIVSQVYWMARINKKNRLIKEIKSSVKNKDSDIEELRIKSKDLLNQQKTEINRLNTKLSQYEGGLNKLEKTVNILNTKLMKNESLLDEREKRIEALNNQLEHREEKIRGLTQQIIEKDESIEIMKKRTKDAINSHNGQIEELEENIRKLQQQRNVNIENIGQLKTEIKDLLKNNQDKVTQVKHFEAKIAEAERTIFEKTQLVLSQKNRIAMMQDDFTRILGIGLRVSTILRSAGINNFQKLGSTDVNKIMEILEKENPNLLNITDPSIWPKQARLASEQNWEALEILQESLRESNIRNRAMKSRKS